MKINEENWTHSQYTSSPLRAFISLGAQPDEQTGVQLQFLVTLTDQDYLELFQSSHSNIHEALAVLNQKYGHWNYADALNASGDGCSSCAAH